MIKLTRTAPPTEMTDEWVAEQTAKFIANKELRVWSEEFLKKALLGMSGYKCAYSEIKLGEEGKIMEVEHFLPKAIYKSLVLDWNNLLPSSRHCNNTKLERDPTEHPIINPVDDDPRDHLYLLDYTMYGRTQKGKNSIIILKLNDSDHLITPRREVGAAVRTELFKQYEWMLRFSADGITPDEELRIIASLENLMKQGRAKEPYSATVSTTVLDDPHYLLLKTFLFANTLWSNDLQVLEDELMRLRLDTKP